MKVSRIAVAIILWSQCFFTQQQKYTMTEAVNGLRTNLAIENIYHFKWMPEGQSYTQRIKNAYLITEIGNQKQDTLLSLYNINQIWPKNHQLKQLPIIDFKNSRTAYFREANTYYKLQKQNDSWQVTPWISIPEEAENIHTIEDKNMVVYTLKNNLYYKTGSQEFAITKDKNPNIINGQSVHRQEFGIENGIFIAPNKQLIAFYKMDESMVEDYPIINWTTTPAEHQNIKYPMAGRKSHEVSLGIYNFKTKTQQFVNIEGDKEQYLTAITWSPDSRYIFVGILNRAQNHLKMNQYDATTGQLVKTIFEEKNDKYVEPQHPLIFLPNSNTDFIWQSQRTGYNHLFHYHTTKGLVAQLTKGDWLVTEILGFNEKKKELYFSSTKETPLERHLYSVNYQDKKIRQLTNTPGIHHAILNQNGEWIYDSYSNADTPRAINLINTQSLNSRNILTATNPLANYQKPEVRNITLNAEDGTPLYAKLILPTDFDTSKKYPVIVYLYNGPHLQLITNGFPATGNLWYDYMAQNGYIIFTMDGRGSSNRGLKFEQAVHRNLGTVEMSDQLKGVDYLKSLPFVDSQNMGIHGWSFGGFMTTNFMLNHPDVFKVGVAGGPVIDWNMYEIMYTERYMGTPQNNPEGYETANLLTKVQNLKGKLLMIHGVQDDVVVWQHSIKFLKAAVDKGVQIDYFIYPGHAHNVIGHDRVHLMQKVTDYFNLHLKK